MKKTMGGKSNLGQQPIWTGSKSASTDQSKVARRPSGGNLGTRTSKPIPHKAK